MHSFHLFVVVSFFFPNIVSSISYICPTYGILDTNFMYIIGRPLILYLMFYPECDKKYTNSVIFFSYKLYSLVFSECHVVLINIIMFSFVSSNVLCFVKFTE